MRTLLVSTLGTVLLLSTPASSVVTIDWTLVGDPGNGCDPQSQGCFGSVGYGYQISKYEVTDRQWALLIKGLSPAIQERIRKAAQDVLTTYTSPATWQHVVTDLPYKGPQDYQPVIRAVTVPTYSPGARSWSAR